MVPPKRDRIEVGSDSFHWFDYVTEIVSFLVEPLARHWRRWIVSQRQEIPSDTPDRQVLPAPDWLVIDKDREESPIKKRRIQIEEIHTPVVKRPSPVGSSVTSHITVTPSNPLPPIRPLTSLSHLKTHRSRQRTPSSSTMDSSKTPHRHLWTPKPKPDLLARLLAGESINYQQAVQSGYEGSESEYQGFVKYARALSRESPATPLNTKSEVNLMQRYEQSATGLDRTKPVTISMNQLSLNKTSERVIKSTETPTAKKPVLADDPWMKQFREKIQNILAKPTDTPIYNQLEKKEKELDKKLEKPMKSILLPLSKKAERKVDRWLFSRDDKIICEKFNVKLCGRDLATLQPGHWLNDEVEHSVAVLSYFQIVNFYVKLIVERDSKQKLYSFNTFFYNNLSKQGYNSVRRWTKSVDIFQMEMILIPIHLPGHWVMAVIDFVDKQIRYYDSMRGNGTRVLKVLRDYLESESQDKRKIPFDYAGWTELNVKDNPTQQNGYDCGVFVCVNSNYLARRARLDFSQRDMPYFRRRIAYEIGTKQLLSCPESPSQIPLPESDDEESEESSEEEIQKPIHANDSDSDDCIIVLG